MTQQTNPECPQCGMHNTYPDGSLLICADCGYEWTNTSETIDELIVKDAHGTRLYDGDTVTLIKDLNVKGSSTTLKIGTKIKNIRLVDGDHNIDAGSFMLKSCFLKKA